MGKNFSKRIIEEEQYIKQTRKTTMGESRTKGRAK
jgi:hypothetical protein